MHNLVFAECLVVLHWSWFLLKYWCTVFASYAATYFHHVSVYAIDYFPGIERPPSKDGAAMCGTFVGPGGLGEVVKIDCEKGFRGRYIVIQLGGHSILQMCEVEVMSGLYLKLYSIDRLSTLVAHCKCHYQQYNLHSNVNMCVHFQINFVWSPKFLYSEALKCSSLLAFPFYCFIYYL